MSSANCKTILIAPLDWGLGHTTRCVPLISYLQQQAHHIIFAGNEWQRHFINNTFKGIETIHLEGYNVNYGKSGKNLRFSLFSQIPHLLKAIRKEQQWLQERLESHSFDAIISDNRYGLWHPTTPSAIMTHQLHLITGMGSGADALFQQLHYKFLNRFQQCWVVDTPGSDNLAGRLSHPKALPKNGKYMGLLSQFANTTKIEEKDTLLILLSGPEPQRGILSKILWEQVQGYSGKVVFVEGSSKANVPAEIPPHICYHQQLTKDALLPILQEAAMVICRSGYSTLMDLVALGKKAIVIPTPGQTEQEYLGRHLHKEGLYYCVAQKDIELPKALTEAHQFSFNKTAIQSSFDLYKPVMDNWLSNK